MTFDLIFTLEQHAQEYVMEIEASNERAAKLSAYVQLDGIMDMGYTVEHEHLVEAGWNDDMRAKMVEWV